MNARGLVAEFSSPDAAVTAARELRALGYTRLDALSPYPVPELEGPLGIRRTTIPVAVFTAGALGCAFAYLVVWYCNAYDYPLNVGGRPLDSLPASIPLMFESTVLLAGLTAFVAVFALSGLPRLHLPVMELPGFEETSLDRFWLVIDARDEAFEPEVSERLVGMGAVVRPFGAEGLGAEPFEPTGGGP